MTSDKPLLRTTQLAKTFRLGFFRRRVDAVRDVSLEVLPGQIFGLLGPNGAGKTTTLKMLMGLIRPSHGHAELFGLPIGNVAVRRRLGYLPESPYFYDYLTAREFLILAGQLSDLSRKKSAARADELIDRVGLTHALKLPLRRYSKGMLQRIGLAQTLIHDPELVVLDEPLTGLDPLGRKQLREIIQMLRQEGKTVVLSSHILSDVELLADRVAIIVKGKSVATGKLTDLLDPRTLSTEILASNVSSDLRQELENQGHHLVSVDGLIRLTIKHDADAAAPDLVNPLVDRLRKADAHLRAITPRKESLEDVVVRQATLAEHPKRLEIDD